MSEGAATVIDVVSSPSSAPLADAPPVLDDPAVALDRWQTIVADLPASTSAIVAGGPGSGKTRTLIEVVARRLLTDRVDPRDVLVLAPTRATATALRDVLARRVGIALPGPLARTAASVAAEIARADAAARGEQAPRLLTGAEQDAIIGELLDGDAEADAASAAGDTGSADGQDTTPWPDHLGPEIRALSTFRTELRELLGRCQEADLRPDELRRLGARLERPEWVAAGHFFDRYYAVLDSYRGSFLDSAEIIAEAAAIVAAGRSVRVPRLVLIDDAQELTVGVIELVRGWARHGATVLAFGDPDVGVTGFRGGRGDLFAALGAQLGVEMTVLALPASHRVAGPVAEMLGHVTSRVGARVTAHRARVIPDGAEPTELLRIEAPTRADEVARLGRRLRELHVLDGVPWSRMAVVLRSGAAVPSFARSLSIHGVPTKTTLAPRALRDEWAARALVLAVDAAIRPEGLEIDTAHDLLLGPLGGIDILALRRLRLALRHEELGSGGSRSADDLLLAALADPDRLATIDTAVARRASRLAGTLARVREQHAQGTTIDELLWTVWDRSGLATTWSAASDGTGVLADEANRHLDSVVALFASAERSVERTPERAASEFITEFLQSAVPEDSLAARARGESVLVGTAAALIGLEFDVTAVASLQDGVWPNPRLRGSLLHADELSAAVEGEPLDVLDARTAVLHDELRMFALAISRARHLVILGAVSSADEQPSALMRLVPDGTPVATDGEPLTLRGMVGRLRRDLASGRRPAAASALARLAREGVPGASPAEWYGLREASIEAPLVDLEDPEARVQVSPSRLALVEKSPLGWFIDTMAASPSGFKADLGTLLHSAMETLSTTPGARLDTDAVMAVVDERWGEFRFDSEWEKEFERGRARVRAAGLADYLTSFERNGHILAGAETQFSFTLGVAEVRGTIDRIEHTTDGEVVIVDLKTGSTVPTKTELADHAQLGLYQLAAEHGGLGELPESATRGGAKLVFIHEGVSGRQYREYVQPALDPDGFDAFRARVEEAARVMAGSLFPGVGGLSERDPHSGYPYRVHLIPAVSS